jgi:hypothetical protein
MVAGGIAIKAAALRPYGARNAGGLTVFHAALNDHARLVEWGQKLTLKVLSIATSAARCRDRSRPSHGPG